MSSLFSPPRPLSRFLATLLIHAQLATVTAELFATGSSAAIQDPLIHPLSKTCPVAQDGITFNTFPWTYDPTCVHAVIPTGDGSGKHQDFCVYTNSHFAGGRGISLVTTPEVAASLTAESFSPYEEELEGPISYEARETEGQGIGIFAKKQIPAGETIILKSPVLFVAREALNTPSRQRRHLLLKKAVEQLPEKTREMFMGLAKSRGGFEIDDIVQTNSMGMRLWDGTGHLGVVPEAARINHACRPNAYYRFDDHTLSLDVFTLKDIKPGEELTFSYGYSTHPHESRLDVLETHWGFTCTCPLCTAPSATISASDARLSQISDIKAVLPTDPSSIPQLLGLLPNLIELLEEEDLIIERPMYEEILAYTWAAFGEEERARHWAGRARRGWEIVAGKRSWEARRTAELEADVKAHGAWKSWEGDPWDVAPGR